MAEWSIAKSWPIAPTGPGFDAAYLVRLIDKAEAIRDLVVEFAAPSALASVGYAEEVARRFRGEREPPTRVVVDVARNVRVIGRPTGEADGITTGE